MYKNMHKEQLASLDHKIILMEQDLLECQSNLKWFAEFDHEQAYSDLCYRNRSVQEVRLKLIELTTTINSFKQQIDAHRSKAGGLLSFLFQTSEQVVAQRHANELEERLKPILQEKNGAESALADHEKHKDQLERDLKRYNQFDPLAGESTIVGLTYELTLTKEMAEQARIASDRWESMAGDLARQWTLVQKELAALQVRIDLATYYEGQLSIANSGDEKRQIHEQCESDFGEGSPRRVITSLTAERRKLTRDNEKLEARLRDVIRLLESQIQTLVLDGNNLCYAPAENGKERFIGIDALKALVNYLSAKYKVILIFDSGIRRLLKMNDASLKVEFPTAVVTVMHSKAKADEGILGAAEFDKTAYIVSNDRFAEYREHPAVQDHRLLTHIIHPYSVQIQQLQVNVPY